LDATNVFKNKKISVITNIGYDHKEILGNSIKEIADDKCHILSGAEFAICSKQDYSEVYEIFQEHCERYGIKKENRGARNHCLFNQFIEVQITNWFSRRL
jgi:folylpolyglutamate synthase/dihydropteroate synthase